MKILPYREFILLPEGTIYSYYTPCIFEGLYRKGGVIWYEPVTKQQEESNFPMNEAGEIAADFWEMSLLGEQDILDQSVLLADSETRWGMYDYDQQFAVYEKDDLTTLANHFLNAKEL